MILVELNVISDVLTGDLSWREWTQAALSHAAVHDEVAIDPINYAEITSGFATTSELTLSLGARAFRRLPLLTRIPAAANRKFPGNVGKNSLISIETKRWRFSPGSQGLK